MSPTEHYIQRNARLQLFSSVGELADISFQRATWLDPEMQNPHFSCVEFVESFYDIAAGEYDENDPDATRAPLHHWFQQGVLTTVERDTIWPVHLALKDFHPKDYYDHEAILADPTWRAVAEAAATAREALRLVLKQPEELAQFENELPSSPQKRWP